MIEPLAWDSRHFGIPVASLDGTGLTDKQWRQAIRQARRKGVELLYVATSSDQLLSEEMLKTISGQSVDRRRTYRVHPLTPRNPALPAPSGVRIVPWTSKTVTPRLVELAVLAGRFSRFRLDPRVPYERFHSLYEKWIERSVAGAIADTVFVAETTDHRQQPVGLVTISRRETVGSIGLIAVADEAAGRGIGKALIHQALDALAALGAQEAIVATQEMNHPACRLYERCGFHLHETSTIHHLWLGAADGALKTNVLTRIPFPEPTLAPPSFAAMPAIAQGMRESA